MKVEGKPSKIQPIRIKINLGQEAIDVHKYGHCGKLDKTFQSSRLQYSGHQETRSDWKEPEEVESVEEVAFKPVCPGNQGGVQIAFLPP